jgi:hypothetical protein
MTTASFFGGEIFNSRRVTEAGDSHGSSNASFMELCAATRNSKPGCRREFGNAVRFKKMSFEMDYKYRVARLYHAP